MGQPADGQGRADGALRPHPRRAADPADRDISGFPHAIAGTDFTTVGQIFSAEHNPDRKKPFDIRTVMRAVSDQDHPVLERWAGMADASAVEVGSVDAIISAAELRSRIIEAIEHGMKRRASGTGRGAAVPGGPGFLALGAGR